jgi:hypothetical protein
MDILKTIRLVTIVSLALTSGCIVVARQADAKADIGYRQIPVGSNLAHSDLGQDLTGDDIVGLGAPQARDQYVHDRVRRVGMGAPVQRTYVTAGMSVERLRAPNAVWQIYDQRPKQWVMCSVPGMNGGTGGYVTCGGSCKAGLICCSGGPGGFTCRKVSRSR